MCNQDERYSEGIFDLMRQYVRINGVRRIAFDRPELDRSVSRWLTVTLSSERAGRMSGSLLKHHASELAAEVHPEFARRTIVERLGETKKHWLTRKSIPAHPLPLVFDIEHLGTRIR